MRRTSRNAAEYDRRFTRILFNTAHKHPDVQHPLSEGIAAVARFKVDYPRLMKRIPTKVTNRLPTGVGGFTEPTNLQAKTGINPTMSSAEKRQRIHKTMEELTGSTQGPKEFFGKIGGWLKQKSKPSVVISHRLPTKNAHLRPLPEHQMQAFILGHEMRHAVDAMKQSNRRNIIGGLLEQKLVPYDLRRSEWRANIAGVKKVVKEFGLDTKAARRLKVNIYGKNALLGAKSVGKLGIAPAAIGAAIMYKRYLNKKKAAA